MDNTFKYNQVLIFDFKEGWKASLYYSLGNKHNTPLLKVSNKDKNINWEFNFSIDNLNVLHVKDIKDKIHEAINVKCYIEGISDEEESECPEWTDPLDMSYADNLF